MTMPFSQAGDLLTNAAKQLNRIHNLCRDALLFNMDIEPEDIAALGDGSSPEEAKLAKDAKYARSKHFEALHQGTEGIDPSNLRPFFESTRLVSAAKPGKSRSLNYLDYLEEKNDKMVVIIKEVNRELALFIEKEARLRTAVKTNKVVDPAFLPVESRARVTEQELKNNERIIENLHKELQTLRAVEDRISKEGYLNTLAEELKDLKENITLVKGSIVNDVIATKQNSRKLDEMRKHKNSNKETVVLVDTKKKYELLELRLRDAVLKQQQMLLQEKEQEEQIVTLNAKIQKWKGRVDQYEQPVLEAKEAKMMQESIQTWEEQEEKERVGTLANQKEAAYDQHGEYPKSIRDRGQESAGFG